MKPPLIIIGSAPCVRDDLAAIHELLATSDIFFCEYMLVGLDSVDKWLGVPKYFVTLHPDDIPESIQRRAVAIGLGNADFKDIISHVEAPGVTIVQPHEPPSGSSALLGVFAALKMGYERMILAGCPLDGTDYHHIIIAGEKRRAQPYADNQRGWQAHLGSYVGKVRSMSGWTKEFLGYPTEAWLHG